MVQISEDEAKISEYFLNLLGLYGHIYQLMIGD